MNSKEKSISASDWQNITNSWYKSEPCDGTADITPKCAVAQGKERFTINFVVGKEGICSGGGIAVYIPIFFGGVTQKKGFKGFCNYDIDKQTPGSGYLITANTNKKSVAIQVEVSDWSLPSALIIISVVKGSLIRGDKISIIIGDPIDIPVNIQEFAQKVNFLIGVDFDAAGKYRRIKEFPSLQVRGGAPDKLQITAKAIQKVGVPFEIVAAAADKCNRNPSWQYGGKIKFFSTDPKAILPESYRFNNQDEGVRRFTNIIFNTPGTHTITALDMENSIIGKSNPVSTDFMGDDNKIYFGELHVHTSFSDGRGSLDECYKLARDIDNFDFAAISDHFQYFFNIDGKEKWELTKDACRRYYKSGKFVTFLGFEGLPISYGEGGKNVYFRNDAVDVFALIDKDFNNPNRKSCPKLLKNNKNTIIIPHHVKYLYLTDWSFHNDNQRLVEIYSIAGSSETGGKHSVQSALAQGHKLGFIADSDNHFGQLGHDESPYRKAGITAVIAKELTREAVFDALRNRHCYATTGKRILLDFSLNGCMMGEEITFDKSQMTEKRIIKVKVRGTSKIKKIDVVRNNVDIYTHQGKCESEEFEYCDSTDISELLLSPLSSALPNIFYYVRVTQADGEMAWASPVWINIT